MIPRNVVLTIVVNYRSHSLVERCVQSLCRPVGHDDYAHQVVIWENGPDRTVLDLKLGSARKVGDTSVSYTGGDGNLGYARAVNRAYASWMVRSGVRPMAVHCATADVVAEPETLTVLLAALRANHWGAVAPVMTYANGVARPGSYPAITPAHVVVHFMGLRLQQRIGRRPSLEDTPRTVKAVDGAYILFDHSAWRSVGGLDADFGISGDDHDVCRRLRDEGWSIGIVPARRVVHLGGASRRDQPMLCKLDEIHTSVRFVGKFYPRLLPATRIAMALVIARDGRPLSRALGWWARNAPVALTSFAEEIPERFLDSLARFDKWQAEGLSRILRAEWRTTLQTDEAESHQRTGVEV
jgi:GT2 family glycosyltransferase